MILYKTSTYVHKLRKFKQIKYLIPFLYILYPSIPIPLIFSLYSYLYPYPFIPIPLSQSLYPNPFIPIPFPLSFIPIPFSRFIYPYPFIPIPKRANRAKCYQICNSWAKCESLSKSVKFPLIWTKNVQTLHYNS